MYYEKVLEVGAKAKAKRNFFDTKVTYEHPKKLVEFESEFIEAYIKFMPETENDSQQDELKLAMTLFMIDDLDGTDAAGLKNTRDLLLKSFQSSTDSRQVQKINSAYQLLMDNMAK